MSKYNWTLCPETCIVFVTYGRPEISSRSWSSLCAAIEGHRKRIRLVLVDSSSEEEKIIWAKNSEADEIILTPTGTSAATSRNLAAELIFDKCVPEFICMVEDDYGYSDGWYPAMVDHARRLYGVESPWGLSYGIFSSCDSHVQIKAVKDDPANGVSAYLFGAVAYQRLAPARHYLNVMKGWDPDVLGISYAQTGGQTFRNVMRGFCGALIPGELSWPLEEEKSASTWASGKRDPGPPAHSFDVEQYGVIQREVRKMQGKNGGMG